MLVDTGCTITTLLSDDVVKLGINCNNLQICPSPVSTAESFVYPYVLPNVDLMFKVRYGLFNRKEDLGRIHLDNILCMPPTSPTSESTQHTELAHTLLGMDVLRFSENGNMKTNI